METARTRPWIGLRKLANRSQRSGFSFVEVIVVVVIVGIVAAIAAPRFGNAIANKRLEAAVERLERDLGLARRRAMASSKPVTVTFDAQGYSIAGITSINRRSTNYSVVLGAEPYRAALDQVELGGDAEVTFDMYGVPDSAGQIRLRHAARSAVLTIDALTGEISQK